jgi:hypothetical protein
MPPKIYKNDPVGGNLPRLKVTQFFPINVPPGSKFVSLAVHDLYLIGIFDVPDVGRIPYRIHRHTGETTEITFTG